MDVNGFTNVIGAYQPYNSKASDKVEQSDNTKTKKDDSVVSANSDNTKDSGVVYEPSGETSNTETTKNTNKTNPELIAKLQADAEERTANLRSIVEKLIVGQGNAIGTVDDIWSFLRTGNFTVDAETKAKAMADIAEDGYYGVKATSDRIIDFAKVLTGSDPSKIESMRKAFQDGFDAATKTWGDKLPDICQQTYDETMRKFDEWLAESTAPATE